MTIAFIHPHKAFLPEIEAYTNFFSTYGIRTWEATEENKKTLTSDLAWHFMGTDTNRKKNIVTIHEYASASVDPIRKFKDMAKRFVNSRPAYRLFLNEYVKKQFPFTDRVPYGFRDMGVDPHFFELAVQNQYAKEYDFIYTGSVEEVREIEKLLTLFTNDDLKDHSLLILGRGYAQLQKVFSKHLNIQFKGPVPHKEVSAYILKSRYAINYLPDREPFNHQTSTKLLEYAALKIPIISTKYSWIKNLQHDRGGDFFWLNDDLSNFNWKNITAMKYSFPDLKTWTWEKQIRKSGVLEFLQSRFPNLNFQHPVEDVF